MQWWTQTQISSYINPRTWTHKCLLHSVLWRSWTLEVTGEKTHHTVQSCVMDRRTSSSDPVSFERQSIWNKTRHFFCVSVCVCVSCFLKCFVFFSVFRFCCFCVFSFFLSVRVFLFNLCVSFSFACVFRFFRVFRFFLCFSFAFCVFRFFCSVCVFRFFLSCVCFVLFEVNHHKVLRDAEEDHILIDLHFRSCWRSMTSSSVQTLSTRSLCQTFFLGIWTSQVSIDPLQGRVYSCQSSPFQHPKSRVLFSYSLRKQRCPWRWRLRQVSSLLSYSPEEAARDHESHDAVGSHSVARHRSRFSPFLCRMVPDHLSCLEFPSRQYLSLCHSNAALNNGLSDILHVVDISKTWLRDQASINKDRLHIQDRVLRSAVDIFVSVPEIVSIYSRFRRVRLLPLSRYTFRRSSTLTRCQIQRHLLSRRIDMDDVRTFDNLLQ